MAAAGAGGGPALHPAAFTLTWQAALFAFATETHIMTYKLENSTTLYHNSQVSAVTAWTAISMECVHYTNETILGVTDTRSNHYKLTFDLLIYYNM